MIWTTPEAARKVWPDATQLDEDSLVELLEVAQEQCAAYAPALADGATEVPASYRRAVILQAREVHAAADRDGDLIGFEQYAIRQRPLSDTVRKLLRPHRAVPAVG